MQVNCSRCSRPIALTDSVALSNARLQHVECSRPRNLTPEERQLLFVYCSGHPVAECLLCALKYRLIELGADPLGTRTNRCPRCRADLTEQARGHVYRCPMLPAEVREHARAVRDAARLLVKRSQELIGAADILMREAEAALFDRQRALKAAMAARIPGS